MRVPGSPPGREFASYAYALLLAFFGIACASNPSADSVVPALAAGANGGVARAGTPAPTPPAPPPQASAGTGGKPAVASMSAGAQAQAGAGGQSAGSTAPGPVAGTGGNGGAGGGLAAPTMGCAPRMVSGDPQLHFHHIHFNSADPAKDIEFFVKYFAGKMIDFCADAATQAATPAIQTERGYFLFARVAAPPDRTLNSFLEHVGYISSDPTTELRRLKELGVPLWPAGDNLQCPEVEMGTACFMNGYFYTQAPNGARIEVAANPKPPSMGFGHIHLRGPLPDFYSKVLGPALTGTMDMRTYQAQHVDQVNLTNMFVEGRPPENPVDSKGKPIDHFAYSTTDLMGHLERIKGMGIEIAEDVSFKPEYGFKSFFIKSPQGVWVEIVEDSQFKAQ